MDEKCQMDLLYEDYLASDSQYVCIDGMTFYKIISSDVVPLPDDNRLLIVRISNEANFRTGDYVEDEEGSRFILKGVEMIRRSCPSVARWEFETTGFATEPLDTYDIGQYLARSKDVSKL